MLAKKNYKLIKQLFLFFSLSSFLFFLCKKLLGIHLLFFLKKCKYMDVWNLDQWKFSSFFFWKKKKRKLWIHEIIVYLSLILEGLKFYFWKCMNECKEIDFLLLFNIKI